MSRRLYVVLNRAWFYSFVVLVGVLARIGPDISAAVGAVAILSLAYTLVTVAVLNPRRSWWGPEVHGLIGNRSLVRKWAAQDLVVVVLLVIFAAILTGIVES
jgi:hypothetical protein